jgi:hypothetical protein
MRNRRLLESSRRLSESLARSDNGTPIDGSTRRTRRTEAARLAGGGSQPINALKKFNKTRNEKLTSLQNRFAVVLNSDCTWITGYTIVYDKVADNQVDRMDHSASKVYRLVDSEVGTMMLLMIVS